MIASTPSRQVLEETPARVLTFLRAVGTKRDLRTLLFAHGYSQAEQERGWALLHDACGISASSIAPVVANPAREAYDELDAWIESGFRRIGAALVHLHPAEARKVLGGLAGERGTKAVLDVALLLRRLDELETKKPDVIATLTARGITPKERRRLSALVTKAKSAKTPAPPPPDDSVEARRASTLALRAWYVDWAETARAVVRRRDQLIALGLAKRKTRASIEG